MKKLLQVFLISIIFISCREEIVSPDNPAGNINEPVYSRTSFSYTFTINAENITRLVRDNTNLNITSSRIFLIIDDYASGRVEINIQNDDSFIIYSSVFANNTYGIIEEFEGYLPAYITINFIDFTGKFKVILSNSD
ncbi:MAG: hypothetical protein EHM47_09980 [Ignavibacteriales bacterium]|nr:MAG: hypothetical protein EHM47_09980 [Ignavibacteriales bacterium]